VLRKSKKLKNQKHKSDKSFIMKKDIILSGVGGQGILTIAATIGTAAVNKGMNLKQAEVHGMSQRGGDVISNLRLSDHEIYSDLIPKGKADLLISVEPMEALRHVGMLSDEGWMITNSKAFNNISDYPEMEEVYQEIKKIKNHIMIDADDIAKDLGNIKAANIVILGAALEYLGLTYDDLEGSIRMILGRKGEDIIQLNLTALKAGLEAAKKYKNN
jgi:indolepyruvate ferredoxin oxidoreductase beta subunit